jgi:hypothetical protein
MKYIQEKKLECDREPEDWAKIDHIGKQFALAGCVRYVLILDHNCFRKPFRISSVLHRVPRWGAAFRLEGLTTHHETFSNLLLRSSQKKAI